MDQIPAADEEAPRKCRHAAEAICTSEGGTLAAPPGPGRLRVCKDRGVGRLTGHRRDWWHLCWSQ